MTLKRILSMRSGDESLTEKGSKENEKRMEMGFGQLFRGLFSIKESNEVGWK